MQKMGSNSSNDQSLRFVQPLIPGFLHSFFIPNSFVKHLDLDSNNHLHNVVLMTDYQPRRHWDVTLEKDRLFTHGWQDFCLHHHFQIGEFLVFTYQSNFLFHVSVFEPLTCCQRIASSSDHYPKSIPKTKGSKRTRVDLNSTCTTEPNETEDDGEAAIPSTQDDSRCADANLTSYNVEKGMLFLPVGFARKNGLRFKRGKVLIKDAKQRVWPVHLNYKENDGQSYINQGWKSFLYANRLKPGHVISLQLLGGGSCPIIKCCRRYEIGVESNSSWKDNSRKNSS